MLRLVVDPEHPDPVVIQRAADVIRDGGVAAFPTDTLYGLAVDPFNAAAVEKVFVIKGRAPGQAVALVAADVDQIGRDLGALTDLGLRLARSFWPGPLTLVVRAPLNLSAGVTDGGTVGVRVPRSAVARVLCASAGRVLTATSANVSGQQATADPDRVAATLGESIDVLLDGGTTPGGLPSTIVDVTARAPRMIRAGAISWRDIEACVRHE